MSQLVQQLLRIGLSEKEAKIYLSVLELGRASAPVLSRKSKIPRATTYAVLSQLIEKGLVTLVVERGERRYATEHPEQLKKHLELQKQDVERRFDLIDDLMPRLLARYNAESAKPKIRYFEGVDGMNRLRSEFTDYPGDIIQIVAYDTFLALDDAISTKEHRGDLSSSQSSVRSILITDSKEVIPGHDIICITPDIAPIEGEVTVLDDRVVFFSFASGIIAIEITSKTLADTLRTTLEFAWRYAKTL